MKPLVVDNIILCTDPEDYQSGNGFKATKVLERSRRIKLDNGVITNDTPWMMRILPKIAEYFDVGRSELLGWWAQEYGAIAMMQRKALW